VQQDTAVKTLHDNRKALKHEKRSRLSSSSLLSRDRNASEKFKERHTKETRKKRNARCSCSPMQPTANKQHACSINWVEYCSTTNWQDGIVPRWYYTTVL